MSQLKYKYLLCFSRAVSLLLGPNTQQKFQKLRIKDELKCI